MIWGSSIIEIPSGSVIFGMQVLCPSEKPVPPWDLSGMSPETPHHFGASLPVILVILQQKGRA